MTPVETIAVPDAGEILASNRAVVEPAMRAAVDGLPPSIRLVAGYHFGWWDEHGHPQSFDSGKAIRPTLSLLAAQAVGGDVETAIPAAVAVELVHNFSLLHDDVMDGDQTRRHRATAWTVFGSSAAILAGNALLTQASEVLLRSGHPAAPTAVHTLGTTVMRLLDGQSTDIAFTERAEVSLDDCLRMARDKTAALMGCAVTLGALFGESGFDDSEPADPDRRERLRVFAEHLGLAFQIADDKLGVWGDPARTGKPVYSDLRNRKRSIPVVVALTSGTAAGRELAEIYRNVAPSVDWAHAAALVESAGGREWCDIHAARLLADADAELRAAQPTGSAASALTSLARSLVHRDR